jgi:hypothetical protein
MGLSLLAMLFSVFRGHIPDHAVRTTAIAIPAGAVLGVFAAAGTVIGVLAAALWAAISLAFWLF